MKNNLLKMDFQPPSFDGVYELAVKSLRIFAAGFSFFSIVTLLIHLPAEIYWIYSLGGENSSFWTGLKYHSRVDLIFEGLIDAAVIFGATRYLKTGKFPSPFAAFRFSTRKWGLIFLNNFLASFFVVLGLLALVIPGLLLFTSYLFIAPVVCFEKPGKNPLRESRILSIGNREMIVKSVLFILALEVVGHSVLELIKSLLILSFNKGPLLALFIECAEDLLGTLEVIAGLLIYMKLRGIKPVHKKEMWILRWAK